MIDRVEAADYAAIKQGGVAWIEYCETKGLGWRASLSGVDLAAASLGRVTLWRADLTHANLRCANLRGTDLADATLTYADLTRAALTHADLSGADLTRAKLTSTTLTHANLTRANLSYAALTESTLTKTILTGANLSQAKLVHANLTDACLTQVGLSGANLIRANLTRADLNGANLTHANLTKATLTDATLTDAILSRANLIRADLLNADLTQANLNSAKLTGADLTGANLTRANLTRADLNGANLTRANLTRADLTRADLTGADLTGADLTGADLTGAALGMTTLVDLDVSALAGASVLRQLGPSYVDVRTITRSHRHPRIKDFLTACGVPWIFSEYMLDCAKAETARDSSALMQSTFISYGQPDDAFARRLYESLIGRQITVFYFPETARWGERISDEVHDQLNHHDRVILICSEDSLNRPGVLNEIHETLDREAHDGGANYLLPIALDDYLSDPGGWERLQPKLTRRIRARIVGDFRHWQSSTTDYDKALNRLIDALKRFHP